MSNAFFVYEPSRELQKYQNDKKVISPIILQRSEFIHAKAHQSIRNEGTICVGTHVQFVQ